MPTMHRIERHNDNPLFLVITGQHATLMDYQQFQEEAAELFKRFRNGEIPADHFPNIQVIPPYSDPYTVMLNFTSVPNTKGSYVCYVLNPDKLNEVTNNDLPLTFEVRP